MVQKAPGEVLDRGFRQVSLDRGKGALLFKFVKWRHFLTEPRLLVDMVQKTACRCQPTGIDAELLEARPPKMDEGRILIVNLSVFRFRERGTGSLERVALLVQPFLLREVGEFPIQFSLLFVEAIRVDVE